MNIKEVVAGYQNEMIENLSRLVRYDSVSEADENTPFGKEATACLNEALMMCEQYGFETKNLDNYCGYAQIGEGEKVIGILGHLDIVPCGEGWATDPLCATVKNGNIYGRGTTDDKGACVAAMTAMKIVRDMQPDFKKRVRLIMGINEERGSRCLKHYVEKEGDVDYGFTPDGNFPAIYGEKGMVSLRFSSIHTHILDIKGGTVSNAVANHCEIKVKSGSFNKNKLDAEFSMNHMHYELVEEGEVTTIIIEGKSAHASMPELGMNAITHGLMALWEAEYNDEFVDFFHNKIGYYNNGKRMGLNVQDEYGSLTFCVGTIKMENGIIEGSIDIRYPVTMSSKQIIELIDKANNDGRGKIEVLGSSEPLFFDPEGELVKTLVSAYREVTQDMETKPMVIGGGTYAKGIKNTIAFGCEFPKQDRHIHDVNEFITIDELLLQTEIYVCAILKLLEL